MISIEKQQHTPGPAAAKPAIAQPSISETIETLESARPPQTV